MLVKGMSMWAIARVAGVSFNTVAKLLMDAADAAAATHDENVHGIAGRRHIQCDEIWSFAYCKETRVPYAKAAPQEAGDAWTWRALDSDSKLIVSYLTGPRDSQSALNFMDDLIHRITERPQISTDGFKEYREAVNDAFGGDVDFAQLIKEYGKDEDADERKYRPAKFTGMEIGFTSLTNALSKKQEYLCAATALYFYSYNWVKPHGSVRTKRNNRITPAMAAGLTDRPATLEQLVALIDERAPAVNYVRKYGPKSAK